MTHTRGVTPSYKLTGNLSSLIISYLYKYENTYVRILSPPSSSRPSRQVVAYGPRTGRPLERLQSPLHHDALLLAADRVRPPCGHAPAAFKIGAMGEAHAATLAEEVTPC
jgi:hypothetical protein